MLQLGPVDSEHIEVWWGQFPRYHTKGNCSNRNDWIREQLEQWAVTILPSLWAPTHVAICTSLDFKQHVGNGGRNILSTLWQLLHYPAVIVSDITWHDITHVTLCLHVWGCRICGVLAVTLILIVIVQNYLQLVLCPVVSILPSHFCMVSRTLTSPILRGVQNRLARIITKSPPFFCSLPLLRSLHWLTRRFRMLFKISLLTYKTLHAKQLAYLHSILAASLPSQSISKGISLSIPRVKTNTGARAFYSCALSLWNNLLLSVHSTISFATFKKHLKTHLFDLTFPL